VSQLLRFVLDFGSSDRKVRDDAVVALERLDLDLPEAFSIFMIGLGVRDENVRGHLAGVLTRMGPRAKAAVPELLRILPIAPSLTQVMIVNALATIAPHEAGVKEAIRVACFDPLVRNMTDGIREDAYGSG
jgi:hypothetical protein